MSEQRRFVKLPVNTTHQQYLHGDWNRNGIPNIDDRRPLDPNSRKWVSKDLIFSNTIKNIEAIRQSARDKTSKFRHGFQNEFMTDSTHSHWRAKSTWSILDKLFRKQVKLNPYLTNDIIGLRAVALNRESTRQAWSRWSNQKKVPMSQRENKYFTSKDAYRAFHSNLKVNQVPVEAQFMSRGFERLNNLQHEAYKRGDKQALFRYRKDAVKLIRQGQ